MRLSTVHETPEGTDALIARAHPRSVVPLCDRILTAGAIRRRSMPRLARQRFYDAQEGMAAQGLRVIAMSLPASSASNGSAPGSRKILLSRDLPAWKIRRARRSREALGKCREAGIAVIMVTGDHPLTARGDRARDRARPFRRIHVVITGERTARAVTDVQLRSGAGHVRKSSSLASRRRSENAGSSMRSNARDTLWQSPATGSTTRRR